MGNLVEVDYQLAGGGCAPFRAWVVGEKGGQTWTLVWQGTFEVESFKVTEAPGAWRRVLVFL